MLQQAAAIGGVAAGVGVSGAAAAAAALALLAPHRHQCRWLASCAAAAQRAAPHSNNSSSSSWPVQQLEQQQQQQCSQRRAFGSSPSSPSSSSPSSSSPSSSSSITSTSAATTSAAASGLQITVEPLSSPNEGVSLLSLTRAAAKNAIGRQLLRELQEALDTLRQERTTRCVVVRSAVPGVFSAGADLKERAAMTQQEAAEFVTSLRRTFAHVAALPMPTVAVLEGAALGGGAELALACDLRVADTRAAFAWPEARLGIIPGAGGTQRLPRLVGAAAAMELILTARRVPAAEAARLGLVNHCVDEGRAMGRALELAREIAQGAPLSLRAAKAAIAQGSEVDLASGLKLEETLYATLLPTRDRLEGLAAFAEKRPPAFKGE